MKYTAQVLSCVLLSFSRRRSGQLFIHYKRYGMVWYREGRRSASSSSRLLLPQPGQQMYNFFSPPPTLLRLLLCVPRQAAAKETFRISLSLCNTRLWRMSLSTLKRKQSNRSALAVYGSFAPPQIIFPSPDKLLHSYLYLLECAPADAQMIWSLTFSTRRCFAIYL